MEDFVHYLHSCVSIKALNKCIQMSNCKNDELFLGSLRCDPELFHNIFENEIVNDMSCVEEVNRVCLFTENNVEDYKNKIKLFEKKYPIELLPYFFKLIDNVIYKRTITHIEE